MATFTALWPASTGLHSAESVNSAAQSTNKDIDLGSDGIYAAAIQVEVTISSGSPAGDAVIEILGSLDGSNWDTEPLGRQTIAFSATGTKRKTVLVAGVARARLRVTNNTGVTFSLTSRYSGLKQQSA